MVFRPQLEPRAFPELVTVPPGTEPVSLDTLTANAVAVDVAASLILLIVILAAGVIPLTDQRPQGVA